MFRCDRGSLRAPDERTSTLSKVARLASRAIRTVLVLALSVACVSPTAAPGPAPSPSPVATLTSSISRQQAIDRVTQGSSIVLRVDRAEAKRMLLADVKEALGDQDFTPAEIPSRVVWVVAVSGSIQPSRPVPVPSVPWGVWVLDASTENALAAQYGSRGAWPAYFDALPDR